MDLDRHLQVLWRFKSIIAVGVILGVLVAALATFKVSLHGVGYRSPEVWTSTSKVLVTQAGFPWGRTVLGASFPGSAATGASAAGAEAPAATFADPTRLSYLSLVYANFLMGDEIRTMLKQIPPGAGIVANPLRDGAASNADALPIIELATSATKPGDAQRLNVDAIAALRRYLDREQTRSATPKEQRVRLDTIAAPAGAALVEGRKLTAPVAAFLLCVFAAVALAYVLENLRPRLSRYSFATDDDDMPDEVVASSKVARMKRTRA